MEIPAWLFFSFWALISFTFSLLVFETFDKTELCHSVSAVVMLFLKCSLMFFSSCSTTYGVIHRPQWRYGVHRSYLWIVLGFFVALIQCTISRTKGFSWVLLPYVAIKFIWLLHFLPNMKIFSFRYHLIMQFCNISRPVRPLLPVWPLINLIVIGGEYCINPPRNRRIAIQMAVETSLFLVTLESTEVIPTQSLFTTCYLAVVTVVVESSSESFKELLPVAAKAKETFLILSEKKIGKLIEFAVGKVGTILSQYFFRLALAVHYLEVMRAANNMIQRIVSLYFSVRNFLFRVFGVSLWSTIAAKVKEKRIRKWIEFAVGTVCTVLFQYFFRVTSFDQVMAFFYLAVVWVANLVLLGASHDYGVLNFLLGNVVMGSMASQFGLQIKSWLMLGASLLLFGLRLMLQSPTLIYREAEHIKVRLW